MAEITKGYWFNKLADWCAQNSVTIQDVYKGPDYYKITPEERAEVIYKALTGPKVDITGEQL